MQLPVAFCVCKWTFEVRLNQRDVTGQKCVPDVEDKSLVRIPHFSSSSLPPQMVKEYASHASGFIPMGHEEVAVCLILELLVVCAIM